MTNKITNTPIEADWYGSLSQRQMRHQSHSNCIVQPDGTLWVALCNVALSTQLYKSTDNGFSWTRVRETTFESNRYATGNTTKGPLISIMIDEQTRNLDIIQDAWLPIGSTHDISRGRFDLDDIASAPVFKNITSKPTASEGVFDLCYSHRNAILIFNDGSSNISGIEMSPTGTFVDTEVDSADSVAAGPGPTAVCDKNGVAYCAYAKTGINSVRFNKFTISNVSNAWGTAVTVHDLGQTDRWPDDIVIVRDGLENLCIAYGNRDVSAGTVELTYATSIDNGATWDVNAVSRESGYEVYIEPVNSLPTNYVDMIAGRNGGFIITYCDKQTADGFGHTFIRQLTTSDSGATYDLGDQKEIGTRYDGRDVIGAHFFRPTTTKLLNIDNPGHVRISYTVDEGDDQGGTQDITPVTIAQELLSEVALPSTLSTDTGTYSDSTAASGELHVQFNIIGSPQDNVDFNSLGVTGNETLKYTAAFNKVGTNLRFLKYEPIEADLMNDISSYGSPVESRSLIVFDPISYSFPAPQVTASNVDALIERDTRKVYLPADFHLSRTFVVNAGGYLKRTVWLTEFDGNQYEISQVVPRFISNQICYYEANAYVVGPSRDPFSRTILSSET